jgi:hypothetical protein
LVDLHGVCHFGGIFPLDEFAKLIWLCGIHTVGFSMFQLLSSMFECDAISLIYNLIDLKKNKDIRLAFDGLRVSSKESLCRVVLSATCGTPYWFITVQHQSCNKVYNVHLTTKTKTEIFVWFNYGSLHFKIKILVEAN